MGLFLALAVAVITAATVWTVAAKIWWFPAPISALARMFDDHFMFTTILCGFFLVLGQVLLIFVILRGSRNRSEPGMRWVWVMMLTMVLLDASLSLGADRIWQEQMIKPAAADALRIEVTAQQFVWNVRYPGPDGKFGRTRPQLVNDAGGNPLGIDPADPASADDIVTPILFVPRGRPVEVLLRSKDVMHSFFVRELRIKQDAVPGMLIHVKLQADQLGTYEIPCAELCGLGHHRMRGYLEVVETENFERRLRE